MAKLLQVQPVDEEAGDGKPQHWKGHGLVLTLEKELSRAARKKGEYWVINYC